MKHERGVAAITAILIVAVAASAATLMLSQQSAMLDQTALVAARAQADLYARAGIDWTRGILLQDMLGAGNSYDGLDEDWAQPMAALPVERAIVSGAITDEQGKFNLNNLVSGGNKSLPDVQAFQRLLSLLGLSPDLADAVVDWIDIDSDLSGPAGAEDPYYLSLARPYRASNGPMVQVEELYRVRGFDPATVAKLKPYVTTLRDTSPTTVNVNTASDVVLMALMPDMPKTRIENFIAARRTQPIKTTDQLSAFTKPLAGGTPSSLGFKSNFFSVRIVVSQDDVQLATDAQLRRVNGNVAIVWRRPIY